MEKMMQALLTIVQLGLKPLATARSCTGDSWFPSFLLRMSLCRRKINFFSWIFFRLHVKIVEFILKMYPPSNQHSLCLPKRKVSQPPIVRGKSLVSGSVHDDFFFKIISIQASESTGPCVCAGFKEEHRDMENWMVKQIFQGFPTEIPQLWKPPGTHLAVLTLPETNSKSSQNRPKPERKRSFEPTISFQEGRFLFNASK